jgi:hypothetical protein
LKRVVSDGASWTARGSGGVQPSVSTPGRSSGCSGVMAVARRRSCELC